MLTALTSLEPKVAKSLAWPGFKYHEKAATRWIGKLTELKKSPGKINGDICSGRPAFQSNSRIGSPFSTM